MYKINLVKVLLETSKSLKGYGLPKAYHTPFKFVKDCLPKIFLGPFLILYPRYNSATEFL